MEKSEEVFLKQSYYIAGFLGLTCTGAFFALLYLRVFDLSSQSGSQYTPFIFVGTLVLFLILFIRLNDFFLTARGKATLFFCAGIGCLALVPLLIYEMPVFIPALCLGTAATIFLWGFYLSTLSHGALVYLTAMPFSVVGIIVILSNMYQAEILVFVILIFAALAIVIFFFIQKECFSKIEATTLAESNNRNDATKKSRYTIITIGLLIGSSMTLIRAIEPPDISALAFYLGVPIICAGMVTLFLRKKFEFSFESNYARFLAVIAAACLLPIPFLQPELQLIIAAVLIFFGMIGLIVLIGATAETARFLQISPFVSFGIEGAFFIASVFISACLITLGFEVPEFFLSPVSACLLIVFLVVVLQVFVREPAYPTDEIEGDTNTVYSEERPSEEERPPVERGMWKRKICLIAEEKKLSPRQTEVMELLAKGRDTKYIADAFVISATTAKTHIYNLYQKLEVHSRQELIDMVEERQVEPAHAKEPLRK